MCLSYHDEIDHVNRSNWKTKKQTFIQDPEQNATEVKLCFAKQVCCKVLVLVSCEVFKSPLKSRGLESDAVLSRYKVGLGLKV